MIIQTLHEVNRHSPIGVFFYSMDFFFLLSFVFILVRLYSYFFRPTAHVCMLCCIRSVVFQFFFPFSLNFRMDKYNKKFAWVGLFASAAFVQLDNMPVAAAQLRHDTPLLLIIPHIATSQTGSVIYCWLGSPSGQALGIVP